MNIREALNPEKSKEMESLIRKDKLWETTNGRAWINHEGDCKEAHDKLMMIYAMRISNKKKEVLI